MARTPTIAEIVQGCGVIDDFDPARTNPPHRLRFKSSSARLRASWKKRFIPDWPSAKLVKARFLLVGQRAVEFLTGSQRQAEGRPVRPTSACCLAALRRYLFT